MPLTLIVTSAQRLAMGSQASVVLEQGRLIIGRSAQHCDWVLEDPERIISGQHCAVERRNNDFFLTDLSRNGVYRNQNENCIGRGNSVQLQDNDELSLGEYELRVTISPVEAALNPGSQELPTDIFARSDILSALSGSGGPRPAVADEESPTRPASTAANDDLVQALLAGAGLPELSIAADQSPAFFHDVGRLLREVLVQLLHHHHRQPFPGLGDHSDDPGVRDFFASVEDVDEGLGWLLGEDAYAPSVAPLRIGLQALAARHSMVETALEKGLDRFWQQRLPEDTPLDDQEQQRLISILGHLDRAFHTALQERLQRLRATDSRS